MTQGKILFGTVASIGLLALSAVDANAAQAACSGGKELLASGGMVISTEVSSGLGRFLENVLGVAVILSVVGLSVIKSKPAAVTLQDSQQTEADTEDKNAASGSTTQYA